ncbi:MAG TPA: DUF4870 domain-containing protein [Psychrobacter sp.]|nr:DUF4870 domain-containing protein [Psychrobacter sp.]
MPNLEKNSINQSQSAANDTFGSNNSSIVKSPTKMGVSQDSKNLGLLNWLGCLFTGFVVPLVLLLIKKEDSYVQSQAKEALNMFISMIFVYMGLWVITIVFGAIFAPLAMIPLLLMGLTGFAFFIFCVLGAIKCSNGENFKVPFNIRLLK